MKNLDEIRNEINKIDRELVELFEKRMQIVLEVAKDKIKTGKKIYDSKREQEVVNKAISNIKDPNLLSYTKEFFESLMDISKKYQMQIVPSKERTKIKVLKDIKSVGFQGTKGSFSDIATDYLYDNEVNRVEYKTFEKLFKGVQNGEVINGVVPLENSSTGGVNDVLNLLRKYDLYIVTQFDIKINHCLIGLKGTKENDIEYIYSHPQALMQCSTYINKNNSIIACPSTNTAIATRDISKWNDNKKVAIASKKAAKIYDLEIIKSNIQDNDKNVTRFIVINKNIQIGEKASKTSIVFTTAHVPGALFNVLKLFYEFDINISRIESRPNLNRKFEYYFYLDFVGTLEMDEVNKVLEEVKKYCGYFKNLGSYEIIEEL